LVFSKFNLIRLSLLKSILDAIALSGRLQTVVTGTKIDVDCGDIFSYTVVPREVLICTYSQHEEINAPVTVVDTAIFSVKKL
jgi:hypothetical protein